MKHRTYRALNSFALVLLFFAGYLNFFHQDKEPQIQSSGKAQIVSASKGTVLIANPDEYFKTRAKNETSPVPVNN